jgi:hypothetical protein
MKDYYSILGVGRNATEQEIKIAYKKLTIKFHPDKNEGDSFFEDRFKEIQEAYEVLSNLLKRANYDAEVDPRAAREHLSKIDTNYPIITVFEVSKKAIAEGEPINLRWQVIHATDIEVQYLGKVEPTGTKTIRVPMMYDKEKIIIKLTAVNAYINQKIEKTVEVKNKSYKERQIQMLYEHQSELNDATDAVEKIVAEDILIKTEPKQEPRPEKVVEPPQKLKKKPIDPFEKLAKEDDDPLDFEKMRELAKEERLNGILKVIESNEEDAPKLKGSDVFMYVVLVVLLIFITIMSIFVYQMNPF